MIIRITRAEGGDTWWTLARAAAAKAGAPHGLHQLLLDPTVTHVDVFATEKTQLWEWAEQFDGWQLQHGKALDATPFDSTASKASEISEAFLLATRPPERGGPRR